MAFLFINLTAQHQDRRSISQAYALYTRYCGEPVVSLPMVPFVSFQKEKKG
jgi:hypothetical protein